MELSRRAFSTLAASAAAALVLPQAAAHASSHPTATGTTAGTGGGTRRTVTFDRRSLLVDGRRTPLWSGEMHPFRLPSPSLWRDVLQKMRASGYNAVSIYVAWSYHSPAPGVYDFSGVRDLGRFLDTAAETGMYVIARPGPYINGETDAGGYPGWLTTLPGRARTNDPGYLSHVDEWLTAVNQVIAPRQHTRGGSVVVYQLENEYASFVTSATGLQYMAHLYEKVRADGIEVPLFHNDKGRNGYWVPGSFDTGGESGRYLYAFDGYPSPTGNPPDWGWFGSGGAQGGATASPDTPGFMAEFGGGWFDCWGGAEFDGQGYAGSRASRNAAYERRFYLTNLANGISLHNVYMTFGGTSWGWLPASVVYTSYDYGAAIDEARNLTEKIPPMKQIGSMLAAFPDLADMEPADPVTASATSVHTYHLTSAGHGSHLYFLRNDTSTAAVCTLPVQTPAGPVTVPASGQLTVGAKDMKVLATGLSLGRRTLLYTTAQPMWRAVGTQQDLAVLTGRSGDAVETVLPCRTEPRVSVHGGSAQTAYDAEQGTLRINTVLDGLIRIRIEDRGRNATAPLVLFLADDAAAAALWPHTTDVGPVLVSGPALVRTAEADRSALRLTGDSTTASPLTVWAGSTPRRVTWNDRGVAVRATGDGGLAAVRDLPGPGQVRLPVLTGWRRAEENPESAPGFDDTTWRTCDLTSSRSTTKPPAGQPAVLFADDYGFHYGDVWYRSTVDGAGAEILSLSYQAGTAGLLMAWWDGRPLGVNRLPVPTSAQATTQSWSATARFTVPDDLRGDGPHTVAVLVRRMAHEEDGGANDAFTAARGLTAATLDGSPLTWRILGGLPTADPVRGPLNCGGLYGERAGWHLPGYPDRSWRPTALPYTDTRQGVAWYRTTFSLGIPDGTDASLGLTFTDAPDRPYRAQIFLNGWNLGQYVNDVGPQHTFVLPTGILDPRGRNTLALAVLTDGTAPAGPTLPELTVLGLAAGGVPVQKVASPAYRPAHAGHHS